MNRIQLILVPSAAVLLLGLSTALHSADIAGAASLVELASRHSQALARKDSTAFSLLVCWDRILPQDRQSLMSGIVEEASNTTSAFRFLTLEQMDEEVRKGGGTPPIRKPVMRSGVALDFNLPVIGYLMYRSTSKDGQSQGFGAVPVGMKGGRYFFISRVPVT